MLRLYYYYVKNVFNVSFHAQCFKCNLISFNPVFKHENILFYCNFYRRHISSNMNHTIYAVSSGKGKCGVAVIRISGPDTCSVLHKIAGFKKLPEPRKALLRRLKHPENNEILDQGLVLWFPGPQSFTGEDCCELQVHGGTAVVSAVLNALGVLSGLRPAFPGEFTKRAFYSNKMDLTEIEGLADLIHAETEMQRKQALHQMEGALYHRYSRWREQLKRCIAHVEAYIDFSEEENIEEDILQTTNEEVKLIQQDIKRHLQDGRRGERMRDGVKTVIVGAPNVGKSSLLNALCERPAAIVSAQPGTTRDVISYTLDIAGYPVVLSDTAGLRSNTNDLVEREGILRARQTLSEADLKLLVIDSTAYQAWLEEKSSTPLEFTDFLQNYVQELKLEDSVLCCWNIQHMLQWDKVTRDDTSVCLVVFNKLDLVKDLSPIRQICLQYPKYVTGISCKKREHLEPLVEKMKIHLESLCGSPTRENASLSQARHRYHLVACVTALDRYMSMSGNEQEIDQAAEQLRQALTCLGHITGHVSTEQILDVIFKEFCIGK